jgi:hypothetical protein
MKIEMELCPAILAKVQASQPNSPKIRKGASIELFSCAHDAVEWLESEHSTKLAGVVMPARIALPLS